MSKYGIFFTNWATLIFSTPRIKNAKNYEIVDISWVSI